MRIMNNNVIPMMLALGLVSIGAAQDRDHHDRVTRIERGTIIAVRNNQAIDSDHRDNRIYYGTVDQDVRGENGRVAIPRGSQVELIVRVARDNDLVLDLESVTVRGERYAIETSENRVESRSEESPLVGAIIGAITGGQASGRYVRIRRGTILNYRLERPLIVGVPDRGESRDGRHYHDDYYRPR
jgi:hypothetical protein